MNDYQECINWLYSQLPIFQKEGKSAYHPGLDNIKALLKELGNPEKDFKSIHIAGTNGKGSVSHMISSILQESGLTVGLYTSPHLKHFEERVRINGIPISKDTVISFTRVMKKSVVKPSFFEMTVALAFETFKKEDVDIAIIETGMGGRLDSTNVIDPLLSIITNIGLDHQQYLGDTLELIAAEKAGIMKTNTPVVIGKKQQETSEVFINKAKKTGSQIYWAQDFNCTYPTDLKGNYQEENKLTAFASIQQLRSVFSGINLDSIQRGLTNVQANSGLQGRYQTLQNQPKVIADTGHNETAMQWLMPQLTSEKYTSLHMVIGMANDKDSQNILKHFPKNAQYYYCKPDVPRGKDPSVLQREAKNFGLKGDVYKSVNAALENAKKNATENDLIFVGGSTFVVAEII